MVESNLKIVIIHDGLIRDVDPLLIILKEKFGKDGIIHFENSNKGLDYVLTHLNQKTIVLLDINFSQGELSGMQVFDKIRERTALVYVIMITARLLSEINHEDLIRMINNDSVAIENVFNYPEIIQLVEKAAHQMEVRIDSALEQWICYHPTAEKNKPFVISREGKSYSLQNILDEIRLQTVYGQNIEKKILNLAVDLLARQKKNIDG